MRIIYFVLFTITMMFLFSCKEKTGFQIIDFNPINNYQEQNDDIKIINLDYTYAIDSGFVIPSQTQTADGMFHFSFKIANYSGLSKKFYYKIYYQNESYKFPENQDSLEHQFAYENFYGSWENTAIGFKETPKIENDNEFTINDEFRIVGNPRNEVQFICADSLDIPLDPSEINDYKELIKNDPAWYSIIVKKASDGKVSPETQLDMDAVYMTKEYRKKNIYNHRAMRNPRTGNYSFLLVITDEQGYNSIPDYIKDISKTNNNAFSNPYFYYLYGKGINQNNIQTKLINNALKVQAKPVGQKGIYVEYKYEEVDTSSFSCDCNNSFYLYKNAHFSQFFHHVDTNIKMYNIPVLKDILNSDYSIDDYNKNSKQYDEKRLATNLMRTNQPCKTAWFDSSENCIKIINPAASPDHLRKENVGIITRHGFTYGKFRAKVKLPELINNNGVWNGLTNALWLIYQDKQYNDRRTCDKKGYISKNQHGSDAERTTKTLYSEIDFEIVKESIYWPKTSYPKNRNIPSSGQEDPMDIIVTCTNWDLACPKPLKFDVGVHKISYDKKEFILHRWNHWYQALTLKTAENDDEIFGSEFYYFEIEWKPEEIIWRIGPNPNEMRVVGYMNSEYTSIPNNQMVFVITQEYHLSDWWPMAPYKQENIPFPSKDIEGKIYELVIE
ncbi:MAG: hypothetical protein ABIJ97_06355 [Bacteroidota bacterium]